MDCRFVVALGMFDPDPWRSGFGLLGDASKNVSILKSGWEGVMDMRTGSFECCSAS